MSQPVHLHSTRRREFLLAASAAGLVAALLSPTLARAQDPATGDDNNWQAIYKKLIGDAKPVENRLTLELPEIAENGNVVPFALTVDSPMTEASYVKAMHLLSTANPQADVASFYFTPLSGKASVTSRMRLAKTQDVISVAELSDGTFLVGRRTVKVTIGGCGG